MTNSFEISAVHDWQYICKYLNFFNKWVEHPALFIGIYLSDIKIASHLVFHLF